MRVWRELVPEPLKVQDVVALLAGRLERVPAFGVRAEQNPEHNGYWFSWDHPGLSHRVLVDKKTGLMARHLLLENEGGETGILLDLRYIDYDQDRGSGYFWPRTTEVAINYLWTRSHMRHRLPNDRCRLSGLRRMMIQRSLDRKSVV